ncbi:hypothetical protein K8B83_14910 [Shewanella inventionis]|uniref:hypothetical protein n=1 Tax=Shewanella inventionis TaxID=1738770 RepID=UPI001CBD7912|nr:hypothetical protein [Shewanella inventionis]UAL42164.1 hypothetical protein K8B83_14910 [Shewanella inventionis]
MSQRYRYSDFVTEDGVKLLLEVFNEVKQTPKGAWVEHSKWYSKKRFVLNGGGKRYCHQTKQQAWNAYRRRKLSQRRLAADALAKAEYALEQIALMDSPPEESKILGKPEYWFNYVFD